MTQFRPRLKLILAVVWVLMAQATSAQDDSEIDFDLFRVDEVITVWVDASCVLTAKRVQQLKDGVSVDVEVRLALKRPKRLWGETTCRQASTYFRLSHGVVTGLYRLDRPSGDSIITSTFPSLAKLHRQLSDSVVLDMVPMACLEERRNYTLHLDISSISLTTLNLASPDNPQTESDSPIRVLFTSFLDLTGHGRTDFSARSAPFSLSEIPIKE